MGPTDQQIQLMDQEWKSAVSPFLSGFNEKDYWTQQSIETKQPKHKTVANFRRAWGKNSKYWPS